MKRILKKILDIILFILTGKGPVADEGVDNEICDFSGQGRDNHGR